MYLTFEILFGFRCDAPFKILFACHQAPSSFSFPDWEGAALKFFTQIHIFHIIISSLIIK